MIYALIFFLNQCVCIVFDNFWSKKLNERYLNGQVPNGPSPELLVRS